MIVPSAPNIGTPHDIAATEWTDEEIHVGKHAVYVRCGNVILQRKAASALLKKTGVIRHHTARIDY